MKKILLIALTALFLSSASAQNILVVNDNDNITYNTDTVLIALNNTMYSGYDYWSIPDSGGVYPSSVVLDAYDLVIWYTSTDGLGLALWDGSTSGNAELVSHILTGSPVWIIGQDALYQMYGTGGTSFIAGEFAYDFMGLSSYDVQSYADDGSLGVPQVDRVGSASTIFPDSLIWIFSTLWYVDGCTGNSGTQSIYEMGPSGYPLSGSASMLHSVFPGNNVMSTFFDPALIDSRANRVNFMESGITYLLGTSNVSEVNSISELNFYPNPAKSFMNIQVEQNASVNIYNANGQPVINVNLASGWNQVNIETLPTGIYFIKVQNNFINQSSRLIIEK